jgi:glycosyltransferase involved in cell wall biosynthesis
MRILFVSNYFPPEHSGGYELWCQETARALVTRGHSVTVLTSASVLLESTALDHGVEIQRKLNLEVVGGLNSSLVRRALHRKLEAENRETLEGVFSRFDPDVALAWGLWNVPRSVPALLERKLEGRLAYYLSDYWPMLPSTYWQQLNAPARRPFFKLPKRAVAKLLNGWIGDGASESLKFEHPICVTRSLRDRLAGAGIPVSHGAVVYGGTDTSEFVTVVRHSRTEGSPLRAVYIGRLLSDKGVHTAVEAIALTNAEKVEVTLDIYGRGESSYRSLLEGMIEKYSLQTQVRLLEPLARADIPRLLSRYEVLVFPSEWDEPFGRAIIEGLAAGLCVVGTRTGGAGEILTDEVNGLSFPPGNARILAEQLRRLVEDHGLRQRLAAAGARQVCEQFSLDRMVCEIESYLQRLVYGPSGATA